MTLSVRIVGRPEFQIKFDRAQIEAMITCSECHYDLVCRNARGDYLHRWRNMVEGGFDIRATFHELDVVSKILEMPPPNASTGRSDT